LLRARERIIYVIDEPDRFGFGYGTLPDHLVRGEERFLVERTTDDAIWYDLRAFSQPGSWMTRLLQRRVRKVQQGFVRGSGRAMQAAVSR
jgi:uncharacterized protein (UPF0548 family)